MEKIRPKKTFFLHMYAYLTSEDKKILRVKKEGGPTPYFFPGPTAAVAGPAYSRLPLTFFQGTLLEFVIRLCMICYDIVDYVHEWTCSIKK